MSHVVACCLMTIAKEERASVPAFALDEEFRHVYGEDNYTNSICLVTEADQVVISGGGAVTLVSLQERNLLPPTPVTFKRLCDLCAEHALRAMDLSQDLYPGAYQERETASYVRLAQKLIDCADELLHETDDHRPRRSILWSLEKYIQAVVHLEDVSAYFPFSKNLTDPYETLQYFDIAYHEQESADEQFAILIYDVHC